MLSLISLCVIAAFVLTQLLWRGPGEFRQRPNERAKIQWRLGPEVECRPGPTTS